VSIVSKVTLIKAQSLFFEPIQMDVFVTCLMQWRLPNVRRINEP